uniref:Apoptosis-associated tyrosine kinase b n=1 Tax=Neogobius melanostomus TaxID=47308 RepID=A0A8C6T182_9GOBI
MSLSCPSHLMNGLFILDWYVHVLLVPYICVCMCVCPRPLSPPRVSLFICVHVYRPVVSACPMCLHVSSQVLLGEVHTGLNTTQVVVKELKSSAGVHDQMHFLAEAQPFRSLQHPALLQCLAQCTEVTPYLVVMEFCPLGDVKGYLRSCRGSEVITPDPLMLQRMACDIASGLMHMHKHNFTHGDLALRNCLLTADVSVKIGDYGLSHTKYKDDYYVTSDQMYVPLRWIAPELIDEVHGNLLVADQTLQSNIWSLGVTIWELFELANQPYRHYSDRQVLMYAVREQQLRLARPLLKVPLAERWYEVMQFCWLQPDQRPTVEEVHLLISYLCAKGASEAEEEFERRWNSLRPNNSHSAYCSSLRDHHATSSSSSFPLLENFTSADGYHSETGDDILTVTETSHGLNFEYKWEQARAAESINQVDRHCEDAFYPPGGIVGSCPTDSMSHGVSPPTYYQPKHLHAPSVLPVLSAHSPSVGSEYYIRIEEPVDCNIDPDYTMCSYSPEYQGSSGSFLTGSAESGECIVCPSQKNMAYWSANKADVYDSNDSSPAISLTMEPLMGQIADTSPIQPWQSGHYVSYKDQDGGYYYEQSPPDLFLIGREHLQESWGSRNLRQALGDFESPLRISPTASTPPQQAFRDNEYLDTTHASVIGKTVTGGYYDMMGSLRKTMPSHMKHHSISIDMETEGALYIGHQDSETEDDEEDIFVERHTCNTWPSKHRHSSHHNRRASHSCRQDAYADFHYTMPTTDIEDTWPEDHTIPAYHSLPKHVEYLESRQVKDNSACLNLSKHHSIVPQDNNAYVYLCHQTDNRSECCHSHFVDPLSGVLVRNNALIHSYTPHNSYTQDKATDVQASDEMINLSPAPGGPAVPKHALNKMVATEDQYVDLTCDDTPLKEKKEDVVKEVAHKQIEARMEDIQLAQKSPPPPADNMHVMVADPQSELSQNVDSGMEGGRSSVSLADILDCSDEDEEDTTDDITDITSGIFVDESSEMTASPAIKSLQKQVGTPDSMDSMDLPSATGSCEGLSPASSHPSSSPKAMDSGYDTENNESPEFVPKEPHETRDQAMSLVLEASQKGEETLLPLSESTPYRDSAYFSDYETERNSKEEDLHGSREEEAESEEGRDQEREGFQVAGDNAALNLDPDNDGNSLELDSVDGALDEWPSQEDWAAEVVGAMEEAIGALNGDCSSNVKDDFEDERKEETTEQVKSTKSHNNLGGATETMHILPKDEVALQQNAHIRRLSSSSSSSSPPATPTPPHPADTYEYEEETDSDDSEEEDVRTFNEQSGGEDSEDECHPVPIIISDDSEAKNLKSLLKMPMLLTTESLQEELDRNKKTVSFFDDVTVYLFDQESPTKELAVHGLALATDGQSSRLSASEDSSDGNVSEESAGYEWDDDFSLLPLPTSSKTLDSPPPPPRSVSRPESKPETKPVTPPVTIPVTRSAESKPAFSRFSVSPTPVSRFSITHISDSDVDSIGGSSEDGEKE